MVLHFEDILFEGKLILKPLRTRNIERAEEILDALEARNYGNDFQTSLDTISALLDNSERNPVKKHSYSVFFNTALVDDVRKILFESQLDRSFMKATMRAHEGI